MSNEYGFHFDNSYARLPEALFARTDPSPWPSPRYCCGTRPWPRPWAWTARR